MLAMGGEGSQCTECATAHHTQLYDALNLFVSQMRGGPITLAEYMQVGTRPAVERAPMANPGTLCLCSCMCAPCTLKTSMMSIPGSPSWE